MIIRLRSFALAAAMLSFALAADIPDISLPVSSLLASANALLAQGDMHGALDHFDAAIKKDPTNYLTIFKRGATYLSLGRASQASADFDAVLSLKPDFEAALLQRAKLKARTGDWNAARKDYRVAGPKHQENVAEVDAAEKAVQSALEAEKASDWETCITDAGTAIMTAQGMVSLRSLRARCRLARGEVHEAVGDLTYVPWDRLSRWDSANLPPPAATLPNSTLAPSMPISRSPPSFTLPPTTTNAPSPSSANVSTATPTPSPAQSPSAA